MQCNIDRKGRWARMITGMLCDAVGSVLVVFAVIGWGSFWLLLVTGLFLMAAGAFMIFEGAVGWCATRAMGFKTPM